MLPSFRKVLISLGFTKFEPTDNAGRTLIQGESADYERNYLLPSAARLELRKLLERLERQSRSERSHQAYAAAYVRKYGSITLRDIRERGCNHPGKLLHRLRKLGVVAPMCMDTWEQGRTGRYKRYWLAGRAVR